MHEALHNNVPLWKPCETQVAPPSAPVSQASAPHSRPSPQPVTGFTVLQSAEQFPRQSLVLPSSQVSVPLTTPSPHAGPVHSPLLQTLLAQSPPLPQGTPVPQPLHVPPQSTPVSLAFLRPSVQLGATQVVLAQASDVQSRSVAHP